MRLYSYIKNNANITKSEVNKIYKDGLIKVNGEIKNLSYIIRNGDIITINDEEIKEKELVYYLYNKPIGVVCTNSSEVNNNIKEITNIENRIYSIGRLDKNSHGLLILTNDGLFTNKVIGKDNHYEKEYIVRVEKKIDDNFIDSIKNEIKLDNRIVKPKDCYLINDYTFGIILLEGVYYEIRRIVKALRLKTIMLFVSEIMPLKTRTSRSE